MTTRLFGAPVKRVEDAALLTGRGRFTDDVSLPGTLHAAFVRSPFAHARINSIDIEAALTMPGVRAVLTAADLPEIVRGKRNLLQVPNPVITEPITQMTLADEEVSFVGEPVAVVVAESRHLAEDAAETVFFDFEPLDVVADLAAAVEPDAPVAHIHLDDNVAARINVGYGDIDAAFRDAAHVVTARYSHRSMPWCVFRH